MYNHLKKYAKCVVVYALPFGIVRVTILEF